ncbi:hypothetical protein KDD17_07710 [Sulfitobacter albidus]|uniref:DUF3016 domain-containing protein n=1 Tax=Sulfitobacter albidus TaxID=2829501 RepID=A0A975PNT8_9RHOB|nr:hypothetical protein [Sulfitobacter albidus]QUJ77811.1 hypothetical protein KDD17_07710 [Sulfitobacter albidus]
MKRTVFATAALTLALGATAATSATMVKEIDVDTELSAIQNERAVEVLTTLDADLEKAIASRLVDRLDDRGARVLIDIDEVSLANSFEQAVGSEDAVLVGDVSLRIPGIANNQNYTLTVSSSQAQAYFPDGTQLADFTLSSDVYYTAMIDAFADNVVRNLDK